MSLIDRFEQEGNWLFRWRGQIPVILVLAAVPVVYYTNAVAIPWRIRYTIMLAGIGLSLAGLVIRIIVVGTTPGGTSGRNRDAQQAESLNTKGVYSLVRHPLYLGNFLMWMGLALYTLNLWFAIIVALCFWLFYERIMITEERHLERLYGDEFRSWSSKVPAFFPLGSNEFQSSGIPFSFKMVLQREYNALLAMVSGFIIIAVMRRFGMTGIVHIANSEIIIFAATVLITFTLRFLKKKTQILTVRDR